MLTIVDHLVKVFVDISYAFSLGKTYVATDSIRKMFSSSQQAVYIYSYLFCSTLASKYPCFSSRVDSRILGGCKLKSLGCNPKCSICFPRIYSSPLLIAGYMVAFKGTFSFWWSKCHQLELTILPLGPLLHWALYLCYGIWHRIEFMHMPIYKLDSDHHKGTQHSVQELVNVIQQHCWRSVCLWY